MAQEKRFSRITRKSSRSSFEVLNGVHRFEHWYRDNQVYFITARCKNRYPAFASEEAKAIFWDRFEHYTAKYEFVPWITCLLDNHYHTLGYVRWGEQLRRMMQRLHGSIAKLVNDVLDANGELRLVRFWRGADGHDYFDGCLRDEVQCRRTYRYILSSPFGMGCVPTRQSIHTCALTLNLNVVSSEHLNSRRF